MYYLCKNFDFWYFPRLYDITKHNEFDGPKESHRGLATLYCFTDMVTCSYIKLQNSLVQASCSLELVTQGLTAI